MELSVLILVSLGTHGPVETWYSHQVTPGIGVTTILDELPPLETDGVSRGTRSCHGTDDLCPSIYLLTWGIVTMESSRFPSGDATDRDSDPQGVTLDSGSTQKTEGVESWKSSHVHE